MKITIVSSYFAPAWGYGGPPKVLFSLGKNLVINGHDIKVITTDSLGEKRSVIIKEKMNGMSVYRLRSISNNLCYRLKLFIVSGLSSEIRDILINSDIIIFSDLRSVFNFQIYSFIKRKRIEFGIFPFGQSMTENTSFSFLKKIFDKIWVKKFVQNADYLFAQNEHEKKILRKVFEASDNKIYLLPLPVDAVIEKGGNSILMKLRLRKKDKIVLFVGRFNYLKGIDILVRAVMPLIKIDKNIKLVLVGRDDGYKSNIKQMISSGFTKNIIVTDPLYNEDLIPLYKRADCFSITPRYFEETSLASLQALSMGTPVVVSRTAEIPYLDKYKAGYVVSGKEEIIRKKISIILYSKKSKYGKRAEKLIKEVFQSNIIADKLLEYISGKK